MDMIKKYKAAEKLLVQNTSQAVLNGRPKITWMDENAFYYPKEFYNGSVIEYQFIKINCKDGSETELFDHAAFKQAKAAAKLTESISFKTIQWEETGFHFKEMDKQFFYDLKSGTINDEGFLIKEEAVISEHYRVFVKEYNLFCQKNEDGSIHQLTFDGEPDNSYAGYAQYSESVKRKKNNESELPSVLFSHNGRKILTYRLDQRNVRQLHVLESFDDEHLHSIRPRLHSYRCPFPEDSDVPLAYLMIVDLDSQEVIPVKTEPFYTGYGLFTEHSSIARWLKDDSLIYTTWVSRGSKVGKLLMIDPRNGECQCVVEEVTDTFLNLGTHGELDGFQEYAFSNFITQDKKKAFWQSERDDFARYFAYDVHSKKCLGAITPADILAQSIVEIDEEKQTIYFVASNLSHCSDPYYEALCKVQFDGSHFQCLTLEDGFHEVSLHGDWFVDTWSRVDHPPVTVLRTTEGTLVKKIVQADISKLLELGYTIPERFVIKASDGITDLYGLIIKPAQLKENQCVPYIDHMYGGMQCYYVPKQFTWDHAQGREIFGGLQSYAQLGIAGIMLDGLGTPGRGKKLHNLSYRNIHGCAGLKDHVYAASQLKKKYPFLNIEQVGIWGNSGGGCATSRAMLEYPEFFKVGVSSAGNHDQRMYNNGWTERYYGLFDEETYLKGDNTALAENLQGKLFIVHGAMDDNVAMSQSIRLVDALIRADKNFDFLILPRVDHNVPADLYFVRRKMDYFVEHLLHQIPPKNYHFSVE